MDPLVPNNSARIREGTGPPLPLLLTIGEAAELMQYWSATLQYSGTEPPKPREVSAKLQWWRRAWREREDLLADQALFSEALPWLERYRDKLIMEDEG